MRKSRFTENQIVETLKQVEGGRRVKDELLSNLVYERMSMSGGLPADLAFIDAVDEPDSINHIGELLEAA